MSSNWFPFWNSAVSTDSNSEAPVPTTDEAASSTVQVRSDSVDIGTIRSLSSNLTSGNWMNWRRSNGQQYLENNENAIKDDDDKEADEDISPDDNGDEVDDHASDRKKSTSSAWSFWNKDPGAPMDSTTESNNSNKNGDDNKGNNNGRDKERKISTSNTILTTTPGMIRKDTPEESDQDDAVLYKPHDDAKQFSKINTHKNENLKENVIVPTWETCLPNQSSLLPNNNITTSIFGNSSTSNQNTGNNKVDIGNWRQFLSQLSSRLGFSSQTLTSVMEDAEEEDAEPSSSSASKHKVEKEFNLLYERTYKLYGRSLSKLPAHKRACLPSYSRFYTKSGNEDTKYTYDEETQLENDANDPNAISITNDPMGNLLINHKAKSSRAPLVKQADILRQKSGPLNKLKKVLIIGVHGFFPTKMIRPLIGAPKGTSLKFANEAEKAIIRYCIENNLINESDSKKLSIQKIALEKEGKIFDRVEFFTEILTKWQEELNAADFIFVASHSQGCVVSIMLLAKLIKTGILKDAINKRIGILGMAGINNGPFYGVDKSFFMKAYSAIEHDSLMELFELTKFTSEQSLVYKQSMQVIISANVKICFIGSINDQLVPLYSALASHIFHPNIYRACYIDHSSQTPLFIQKLVSLCCQLQNMGYFDNNVLKELSTALAGPLTGGGHSKIYNDGKVYDLGVKFVLDTDDLVIPPTSNSTFSYKDQQTSEASPTPKDGLVTSGIGAYGELPTTGAAEVIKIPVTNQVYIKEFNISKIGTNPFILPWCLRGLLFNIEKNWPNNNKLISVEKGNEVGKTGYDEIDDLYDTFDSWKPEGKILKDLKFRLNGLRASKL